MTLAQLNAKIDAVPAWSGCDTPCVQWPDRVLLRYLRDERLGILGVHAGQEPTEEQVQIVHDQLFPNDLTT